MPRTKTSVIHEMPTERNDLALHVDLCQERYRQLVERLDSVDHRLDRMEGLVVEIKEAVSRGTERSLNRYLAWGGSIIAVLASIITALLLHSLRG